jgi:DNA repair exonuclease SbcCD ATPase subunit
LLCTSSSLGSVQGSLCCLDTVKRIINFHSVLIFAFKRNFTKNITYSCLQELLVAEKGALEVRLNTCESSLQHHQQQLSELTQKHTAIQAELADSLEYQQQIETQLNELEMEAQAAKASYEAEQGQSEKLRAEASQTQAELSRAENELTHTNTALTQTSELNRELQVSMRPAVTIWQCYMLCFQHMQLLAVYNLQELQRHWVCMACL